MAIKDRDTVAQSKKAVEDELQQCLASLATANKGNDRDISKIQGELKSMGEGKPPASSPRTSPGVV